MVFGPEREDQIGRWEKIKWRHYGFYRLCLQEKLFGPTNL